MPGPPKVTRGRLLCYRFFDVGDEISLGEAEKRLSVAPGDKRLRFTREGAEAVSLAAPPLSVELGRLPIALPRTGATLEPELRARIYDYGAVSLRFELPIEPGTSLEELIPLCDELYDTTVLDEEGRRQVRSLVDRMGPAVQAPHDWHGDESYTVVFVEQLEGATVDQLLRSDVLPKLVVGEPGEKRLSEEEREDVIKHAYRYFEDDVAVIDWNSAFILEPSGSLDVADILEFATAQLLELRYYDDLLDAELARVYEDFASAKRSPLQLLVSPYPRLARQVLKRLLEITEFTERAENSLKVVGDFYLARIYRAAVRRFRIPTWQQSVDGKQKLVMQVYELLKGEVDIRRSTVLEATIVLLIVFEIVLAFTGALAH